MPQHQPSQAFAPSKPATAQGSYGHTPTQVAEIPPGLLPALTHLAAEAFDRTLKDLEYAERARDHSIAMLGQHQAQLDQALAAHGEARDLLACVLTPAAHDDGCVEQGGR